MGIVKIFSTGGTIASVKDPDTGKIRAAVSGDELLGELGELELPHEVEVENYSSVHSWDMNFEYWLNLARTLREFLARDDSVGAVVPHGTDTLEETAYFLHRTVDSDKPIVVTGAMRNHSELGFDGHQNLYHSLLVAAEPEARGRGTMVVLNDEIHSARWVSKFHTTRPDTFVSVNAGPLGLLNDYRPVFLQQPPRRNPVNLKDLEPVSEDRVMLIKSAAGMSDRLIRFGLEDGVEGFVLESTGCGNLPGSLAGALRETLDRGLPVIVVSRCWAGAAVPMYGTETGGKSLEEMGVRHAGWLNGQKARVHLLTELARGADRDAIYESFDDTRESLPG